jgi:Fur family peroxide stress response transcriptional regulator
MQKQQSKVDNEYFAARCRENGLRITPQRMAIYRMLAGSRDHPSADAVFRRIREEFPSISYDTVNRTLLTFARIGLAEIVDGPGGPRRFDLRTEDHHHFHCRKCGRIVDFQSADYDRLQIPSEIRDRFTVLDKKVVLSGLCDRCIS